ncbi:hypothetical protein ACHHYP_20173 [Achlya hypogyna]|uniref:Ankyrin repeat protein n=1 Tax=Achlya hypogyna TaxID=1202772 RepID=A0A1V9Z1L1_ACHHY|nr:hypothetical protein ACHHYP_20173 [Achlya hypogyna]
MSAFRHRFLWTVCSVSRTRELCYGFNLPPIKSAAAVVATQASAVAKLDSFGGHRMCCHLEWLSIDRYTSLHIAAICGHVAIVRRLLAAGADVNAVDDYKRTPLHWASEYGYGAMVRLLLEAGADTSLKTDEGQTTRDIAKEYNKPEVLHPLDEPALLAAVTQGHVDIVKQLLEAGANPAKTTTDGDLLVIARRNKHDTIAALLETTLTKALFTAAEADSAAEVASVHAQGLAVDCVNEVHFL